MSHPVVHFEMGGPDAKALTDFYGSLFGWKIDANNPMHYPVVFGVEGGIGGGLPGQQGAPARTTVYVSTDDIRSTLKKAQELGGKVEMDVQDARDGAPTLAAFSDPDGNFIGLIEPAPGEQPPPPQGTGDPITWFEIAGVDGQKTRDFYSKLFGWTINADNDIGYGEYHGEEGISGGIFGGMGDPRVTVYATVKDIHAKVKKANELGATTQMEPMAVPGGPTIAMLSDPAGNTFGMILAGTGGA